MSRGKFGSIDFLGKEIGIPSVSFDRLAMSQRGEVLLLSLFAEAQRVKAIRSILAGGAKVTCNASGVKVQQDGQADWYARSPGRLYPTTPEAGGYQCYTHKLQFGLVHTMFISRSPGFMRRVTPESLWQELKSDRYTTPMLKSWVPWLEEQLRKKELLENAYCFNCKCGILGASTKDLDELVSQGIKEGHLLVTKDG